MTTIHENLTHPFDPSDIEWRLQQSGSNSNGFWAMALAYVTNRAIQARLDDIFGPFGWRNEYKQAPCGGVLCGISILHNGEWVTKWDGAENTATEEVKGGLSASMKRAAVQWGIGRYLYKLDTTFVVCSDKKQEGWNYGKTKDKKVFYWQTPQLPKWALPYFLTDEQKLKKMSEVVKGEWVTITDVKDRIADGDYLAVIELMDGLGQEVRDALNIAPTKGGIFTTEENKFFMSQEYQEVRSQYYQEKNK